MPKIKNWTRKDNTAAEFAWSHDTQPLVVSVGEIGDSGVRVVDLTGPDRDRDKLIKRGKMGKEQARKIAVEWMQEHPAGRSKDIAGMSKQDRMRANGGR